MSLPVEAFLMGSQVSHAVRLGARQAGFHSFAFPPCTNTAPDTLGMRSRLLKLFHHFAQDRVSAQQRSRAEHLPALRAAVLAFLLGPVPVVLNAVQTVAVSAGDGHRVSQNLQAHRATELVFFNRNSCCCHFDTLSTDWKVQRWAWLSGVLMKRFSGFTCCMPEASNHSKPGRGRLSQIEQRATVSSSSPHMG